jgi:hypothetical protein
MAAWVPFKDDDRRFTVAMAAAFFDLNASAFRKKEKFLYDKKGEKIEIGRNGTHRSYSLNDILRIAHALRRSDKMTDRQLKLIVLRVDAFKEPVKKHRKKFRKGIKRDD